jgi:hypothetical protein
MMSGNDEIIFTGEYKDFRFCARFGVDGKSGNDVAHILDYISAKIEPYAFKFSGIDTKMIDDIAKPSGKGIPAVYGFFEDHLPKEISGMLAKALPDPALKPAAESYLFNTLLKNAGVAFKATDGQTEIRGEDEKPGEVIGFIGKYGQWIAVKRLGLEKVQDYEVSGILSSVNHTAVNKAFDFALIKKEDTLVDSIVSGKRKSYGNIGMCLREMESKQAGDAYVVCKIFEKLGYKPYASPGMLSEAHPDIKPPKVKGRKPKE